MLQECKLKAVTEMVRCFADIVEGTLRVSDANDDEALKAVAALYHSKANGVHTLCVTYVLCLQARYVVLLSCLSYLLLSTRFCT
jgi:hypothetical protein